MTKLDRIGDRFDVASPLLSLQSGSKTCLFCELVITSKEARNNISVSEMETLKIPVGRGEKWLKVKNQLLAMLKTMNWFEIRSNI